MLVIIGLVADEKIRDMAGRKEMAILDYNTGMNRARKEGIKEGIAEITKLDIEEIEKNTR